MGRGSRQKGNLSFIFHGVQLRKVREMRGKINTGSNWARIGSENKAGACWREHRGMGIDADGQPEP